LYTQIMERVEYEEKIMAEEEEEEEEEECAWR
jgi:hypothetical protein